MELLTCESSARLGNMPYLIWLSSRDAILLSFRSGSTADKTAVIVEARKAKTRRGEGNREGARTAGKWNERELWMNVRVGEADSSAPSAPYLARVAQRATSLSLSHRALLSAVPQNRYRRKYILQTILYRPSVCIYRLRLMYDQSTLINPHRPSGFAHFLFSIFPVLGHRISCHETGSIVAPCRKRQDKVTSRL